MIINANQNTIGVHFVPMKICSSFSVHNVAPNTARLRADPITDVASVVSKNLGTPLACYTPDTDVPAVGLFDRPNLLVTSVYDAFYKHYPLKLNPNVIWLTILQGFGTYVNRHAEALRSKFVNHDGQKLILIIRQDFHYNSPLNDWPSVFPQFASEIEAETHPGVRQLLECSFSNTTDTDRASSHIALMDTCQQYFSYMMFGGCGFPRIDLLGTVEDWRLLRAKAQGLERFVNDDAKHLSVWLSSLLPALDHFVQAAEGHPNLAFWGSVCNLAGLSGNPGDPITGWINVLFPYRLDSMRLVENEELDVWATAFQTAEEVGLEAVMRGAEDAWKRRDRYAIWTRGGIDLKDFPTGLSAAPVRIVWVDVKKTQDVKFYGGMFAMHQHPDGALEVRTGWAVAEPPAVPVPKKPR